MLAKPNEYSLDTTITPNQQPSTQPHPLISADKLRELWAMMVHLRRLRRGAQNQAGRRGHALGFGEACEVGALIDLRPGDTIVALPGQRVGLLAAESARSKTSLPWSPSQVSTAGLYVLEEDCRDRLPLAAGIACAHHFVRKDNVVVVFALRREIARARDSLRFAKKHCLPMIYLEMAGMVPANSRKQSATKELPAMPVDDSDVIAVYRVAYEAIDKARRGAGPSLIQCFRYRKASAKGQPEDQHLADPIAYLEHYLRKKDLWHDDLRAGLGEDSSLPLPPLRTARRSRNGSRQRDTAD